MVCKDAPVSKNIKEKFLFFLPVGTVVCICYAIIELTVAAPSATRGRYPGPTTNKIFQSKLMDDNISYLSRIKYQHLETMFYKGSMKFGCLQEVSAGHGVQVTRPVFYKQGKPLSK